MEKAMLIFKLEVFQVFDDHFSDIGYSMVEL